MHSRGSEFLSVRFQLEQAEELDQKMLHVQVDQVRNNINEQCLTLRLLSSQKFL